MSNDFIGIFDNVLIKEECIPIIDYFESLKKLDLIYTRQDLKDGLAHQKQDETAFPLQHDIITTSLKNPALKLFIDRFWKCYSGYVEKFSILNDCGMHGINSIRIQKTKIGQGYHSWHFESSDFAVSTRIIAYNLYLNDVDEGGETEFLYLHKRIQARTGRLVIWPAAFTHAHRGNPPLSNDKYIITGWLEFMGKA